MHYVSDSWDIDNPAKLSEWKKRDAFEVWQVYFDRLALAAESGLFEIIGHADLPKKFGIRPAQDCAPLYEKFLNAAAKAGCAIELNTAGLRKDCQEIYPSRELLELAFRKKRAHHVWLGRPCAGGSRHEFCRSRPTCARRRLHGILPVHAAKMRTAKF